MRDFCHFRLARHYANGLGIDTTSLTLQDVADIQASDYMRLSKRSRNVMGLLAMLLSVGRYSVVSCYNNPMLLNV